MSKRLLLYALLMVAFVFSLSVNRIDADDEPATPPEPTVVPNTFRPLLHQVMVAERQVAGIDSQLRKTSAYRDKLLNNVGEENTEKWLELHQWELNVRGLEVRRQIRQAVLDHWRERLAEKINAEIERETKQSEEQAVGAFAVEQPASKSVTVIEADKPGANVVITNGAGTKISFTRGVFNNDVVRNVIEGCAGGTANCAVEKTASEHKAAQDRLTARIGQIERQLKSLDRERATIKNLLATSPEGDSRDTRVKQKRIVTRLEDIDSRRTVLEQQHSRLHRMLKSLPHMVSFYPDFVEKSLSISACAAACRDGNVDMTVPGFVRFEEDEDLLLVNADQPTFRTPGMILDAGLEEQLKKSLEQLERQIEETARDIDDKSDRLRKISKKMHTPEEGQNEPDISIDDEVQHNIIKLDLRHSQRVHDDLLKRRTHTEERLRNLAKENQAAADKPIQGAPILNGVPYISRLFKNTGVVRATECPTDEAAIATQKFDMSQAKHVSRSEIVTMWSDLLYGREAALAGRSFSKDESRAMVELQSLDTVKKKEILAQVEEHGMPLLDSLPDLPAQMLAKGHQLNINRSRPNVGVPVTEKDGVRFFKNVKGPEVLRISNEPIQGATSVNAHSFTIHLSGDGHVSAVAVGEKRDEQSQPAQAQGVIVFSTEDEKKDAPKPQVFHLELKGHPHLRVETNENGEGREHEEKLHLMMKQVHHLRQAAENLEQAGDKELAPKLREKAEHLEALARERQAHQAEEMRLRAAKLREGHAARRGLHERENHETAELKELLTAIRRELHALREEVRELRVELDDDDDDEDREGDDDDRHDREHGERDRDESAQLRGTLRSVIPAEGVRFKIGDAVSVIADKRRGTTSSTASETGDSVGEKREAMRIDAKVTEILPNGNLRIRGRRIERNKGRVGNYDMKISAIVRPDAISPDHTVNEKDLTELEMVKSFDADKPKRFVEEVDRTNRKTSTQFRVEW
ncbi:MAG: flagellar basal body L-ring protein FlgH [Planctomycetaceae bacterium]